MFMSVAAAPSATVKVRVPPSRFIVPGFTLARALVIVAVAADAKVVTLPSSNNVPATLASELRVSVPPVISKPRPPLRTFSTPPVAPP